MKKSEHRELQRDNDISSFGEILKKLCDRFEKIETAVFYDALGETIDYHSYRDPYSTRLIAAHHGLIFEFAREKLIWLEMGNIDMFEIFSENCDSVTIRIGDEICLTVVTEAGAIDSEMYAFLEETKVALRAEAGF